MTINAAARAGEAGPGVSTQAPNWVNKHGRPHSRNREPENRLHVDQFQERQGLESHGRDGGRTRKQRIRRGVRASTLLVRAPGGQSGMGRLSGNGGRGRASDRCVGAQRLEWSVPHGSAPRQSWAPGVFRDPNRRGLEGGFRAQPQPKAHCPPSPPPCSLAQVRPDGQSRATGSRVYPGGGCPNLNSLVSVSGAASDRCMGFVYRQKTGGFGGHRGPGGEACEVAGRCVCLVPGGSCEHGGPSGPVSSE